MWRRRAVGNLGVFQARSQFGIMPLIAAAGRVSMRQLLARGWQCQVRRRFGALTVAAAEDGAISQWPSDERRGHRDDERRYGGPVS